MPRQLLILDLDETLIHGVEEPLSGPPADFVVGPFQVYRRPYVKQFLSAVAEWYDLAVWSSASGPYVAGIVEHLIGEAYPLKFAWARERCTQRYDADWQSHYWIKNLSKARRFGYSLEKILIVDDSFEKVHRNYGNHIHVRAFTGDQHDAELLNLLPFLDWLRAVENVRTIEKRNWRSFQPDGGR